MMFVTTLHTYGHTSFFTAICLLNYYLFLLYSYFIFFCQWFAGIIHDPYGWLCMAWDAYPNLLGGTCYQLTMLTLKVVIQ